MRERRATAFSRFPLCRGAAWAVSPFLAPPPLPFSALGPAPGAGCFLGFSAFPAFSGFSAFSAFSVASRALAAFPPFPAFPLFPASRLFPVCPVSRRSYQVHPWFHVVQNISPLTVATRMRRLLPVDASFTRRVPTRVGSSRLRVEQHHVGHMDGAPPAGRSPLAGSSGSARVCRFMMLTPSMMSRCCSG